MKVKDRVAGVLAGDCIACRSCVNACPTGTDIRRGLQPECIGTAQCIDACDEVMLGQGKPIGLIKYTSETRAEGGRPAHLAGPQPRLPRPHDGRLGDARRPRPDARRRARRGRPRAGASRTGSCRTARSRTSSASGSRTSSHETQSFTIEVLDPAGASLVLSESPVVVAPGQLVTVNAVTTVPQGVFVGRPGPVRYLVTLRQGLPQGGRVPPPRPLRRRPGGEAVKLLRLVSEYRWPIYLGGLLTMSIVACGILVWVATRPDSPRPIQRLLRGGAGVGRRRGRRGGEPPARLDGPLRAPGRRPALPGHAAPGRRPRRRTATGTPVAGLAGRLFAIRPSDARLNQTGDARRAAAGGRELPDARPPRRAGRLGAPDRREARRAPLRPRGAPRRRAGPPPRRRDRRSDPPPREPAPAASPPWRARTAASRSRPASSARARRSSSAAPAAGRSTPS